MDAEARQAAEAGPRRACLVLGTAWPYRGARRTPDGYGAAGRRAGQCFGRQSRTASRHCCGTRPTCWWCRPCPVIPSLATALPGSPGARQSHCPAAEIPPALTICAGPFSAPRPRRCWRDDPLAGAAAPPSWPRFPLFIGDATFALPDGLILWQLRVPRTLLGMLVGGGLGLSWRRCREVPCAIRWPSRTAWHHRHGGPGSGDRILLGICGHLRFPTLPAGGLLGAGIGAAFLLGFAGRAPSGPSLILAGVAVSAIASALLALALTLAPNPFALTEITFWLRWEAWATGPLWRVALAAPAILLGGMILLSSLAAASTRSAWARILREALGVPLSPVLQLAAVGTAFAVGTVRGSRRIDWLHRPGGAAFAAPLAGRAAGALLPAAPLAGAALLLAADMLVRLAPMLLPLSAAPPVGVLIGTARCAVPGGDRPAGPHLDECVASVDRAGRSPGACTMSSLTAMPGELVALCGPNGAGKSTLLRALAGLLPDTSPPDPRRVAWLPQGAPRSVWGLTVEQVAASGESASRPEQSAGNQGFAALRY